MAGRREERAERLREQILDAAVVCLSRGGLRSDRLLSAISREAGLSRPTLYRHFASFEELRDAVIQREVARLVDGVLPMIDNLTWSADAIVDLLTYVVRYARDHPLFKAAIRDIPDEILPQFTTDAYVPVSFAMAIIEPRLEALVANGTFPPIDVKVAADLLARIALSLAFTNTTIDLDDQARLRDYLRAAVHLAAHVELSPGQAAAP